MKSQTRYEMLAAGTRIGTLSRTFPSRRTLRAAGADAVRCGDISKPRSFAVVAIKN